jgi:hypothetical protein
MTTHEPPPRREIGHRFRRPLTAAELETIAATARRPGGNGGLDGAFRAIWDIILSDADGMTMAEAAERALKFHPADIWHRHRGPRYPKQEAADLRWFNIGPASYPDCEAERVRSPHATRCRGYEDL